jgi:hypothetical protein
MVGQERLAGKVPLRRHCLPVSGTADWEKCRAGATQAGRQAQTMRYLPTV